MKNGLFKSFWLAIFFAGAITLPGCATFLEFGETEEDVAYDRGYYGEEEEDIAEDACSGRSCGEVSETYRAPADEESNQINRAIEMRDVVLGMTRQQVTESWGRPTQREVAGNGSAGHERWTYGSSYSLDGARTIIFENGRVSGWHR